MQTVVISTSIIPGTTMEFRGVSMALKGRSKWLSPMKG